MDPLVRQLRRKGEFFMKQNKKRNIIIAIVVVAVIAIMGIAYLTLKPSTQSGAKAITVVVNHLNGDAKTYEFRTDAEYLRQAMEEQELVGGVESDYGLWVQTVDGETANEANEEWWGFTVNGEIMTRRRTTKTVTMNTYYSVNICIFTNGMK